MIKSVLFRACKVFRITGATKITAEAITGHTELIGLDGLPDPSFQNHGGKRKYVFAKLGYDYAYLAFEVGADEIEDAVKAILYSENERIQRIHAEQNTGRTVS